MLRLEARKESGLAPEFTLQTRGTGVWPGGLLRFSYGLFIAAAVLSSGCSGSSTPAPGSSGPGNAATGGAGELTPVTFRVPTMVCTKSCWPAVRDALQKEPGVQDVTLAPQQEEVAIDNPLVTVTPNGSFDVKQAIQAIAAAGFGNATVEN